MERSVFNRTGPTEKSGPPRKVGQFFWNFSGWTEWIHSVLDWNLQKFWLNGSRPTKCSWNISSRNRCSHSQENLLHLYMRGSPTLYTWRVIGWFTFSWKVINSFYPWFVIKDDKIFPCPHEQIIYLNVTWEWRVELSPVPTDMTTLEIKFQGFKKTFYCPVIHMHWHSSV